ncbi:MAG TPA: metal-sensitive transcriptional regulator [Candidatus Nanopelagicaceae bacterium]
MAKKNAPVLTHVLQDEEQLAAISKRIKRAHGQLGAISRMIDEGRSCEDVVTQMAAVGKAINTAAITLISASLKECIENEDADSAAVTEKLQKLFLSFA